MQFAIPQITTIVLLVHMVLGCCWHHAHACSASGSELPARLEGCSSHADHTHGEGLDDGQRPHDGHDGHEHECEGDRCTFVRSKSSFERDDDWAGGILPVFDVPAAAWDTVGLDHEKVVGETDSFFGNPPLPIRAHLLFSVLLI